MIYITGDTHGDIDFRKLEVYFGIHKCTRDDVLIILGDAGIIWSEKENYSSLYGALGPTVVYLDGNHENFDMLKTFPIVTKYDAHMHKITASVFHVLRGEIIHLDGLSFLALGGARSTDKMYRREGISWWKDENITTEDLHNAEVNLAKAGGHVDYILTHAAPTSIVMMKLGLSPDTNTGALECLMGQASFSHWYFGHYHLDEQIDSRFRCFYQDIVEIPGKDKA